MFGQTHRPILTTLLVFLFLGSFTACLTKRNFSARAAPCECSELQLGGPTIPPDADETASSNDDPAENPSEQSEETPQCTCPECPKQPPASECPKFKEDEDCEEPTTPDARGCFRTIDEYPVEDGQVALTPMNLSLEWTCSAFSEPWWTFTSTEEDPLEFLLLPTPDRLYCVEITRLSGYITLRHEEGDVTRNEGSTIFTWCLQRNSDDFGALGEEEVPALLEVMPLTPEAQFTVQLQRGG